MMKHLLVIFFAILALFSSAHAQWEHLGSGFDNPQNSIFLATHLEVLDSNNIWMAPRLLNNQGTTVQPWTQYSITMDGGSTWITDTVTNDPNLAIWHIYAFNSDTIWIALNSVFSPTFGKLYRTNNAGQTWTEQTGPFNNPGQGIIQMHFFDADTGVAIGREVNSFDTLRIYRTTNGGNTWNRLSPSTLPATIGIEGTQIAGGSSGVISSSGDSLWFGTTEGRIWRTIDQGLTWTATFHGATTGFSGRVLFKNALEGVVAAADNNQLAVTTDGGNTWSQRTTPFPIFWIEDIPNSPGSYIIKDSYTGQANFAITHDNGITWTPHSYAYPIFLGPFYMISPKQFIAGSLIVNSDTGGVLKWIGDDLSQYQGSTCNTCTQSITDFPHIEDYEGNGGDWCQPSTDGFDWQLIPRESPSSNTGPSAPFEGNYYLLMEASTPHLNQTATLVSPCYELKAGCYDSAWFAFNYHMYGSFVDVLDISVSIDSGQTWGSPIWFLTGNQGNLWQADTLDLTPWIGQTIRLRIRGNTNSGGFGDIGLDRLVMDARNVLDISGNVTDLNCHDDTNGQIVTSVSGGIPPITYSWSTGSSSSTISNLGGGSYTLTVMDSFGCTNDEDFIVSAPPALTLALSPDSTNCYGEASGNIFTLAGGGTGVLSFLWSNSANTQNLGNVPAGTYSLTVTDANGCTITDSATIHQPDSLAPNFLITNVSCPGDVDGAVALLASGGMAPYQLFWSFGSDTFATNLAPGPYSYLLADANLCQVSGLFSIGEPDSVSAEFMVTDISCYGEDDGFAMVMPMGGNGGYSYLWSNGVTDNFISGLLEGTYLLTITDSLGCIGMDSVMISEPDSLAISIVVTDESGAGASDGSMDLSVSGGVAPYNYQWSNGETSEDLSGLSSNNNGDSTFQVTVTDANGCITMGSAVLSFFVSISTPFDDISSPIIVPNPSSDAFSLIFTANSSGILSLEIFDVQGKMITKEERHYTSGENRLGLEINPLPVGIYSLVMSNGMGRTILRFEKT